MKWHLTFLLLFLFTGILVAQHGTAPNGYWPMGYNGDTWSGTVKAVNPETREISLSYNGKKGEETFTGTLIKGYKRTKDGTTFEVQISQIPVGSYMVAYYTTKTRKVEGKKEKYNEIFEFELSPSAPKK